jgi:hypothetical protein
MKKNLLFTAILAGSFCTINAQNAKPEDTEYYTPVPKIVTPGNVIGQAPSDAIVLFDGTNLDQWVATKDSTSPNKWTVADNAMTVNKSNGDLQTKKTFMDFQLHIEYRIPSNITGSGQPGEWQTYDVVWTAPRFNEDGSVKSPARATVLLNGVLVQNNTTLTGDTPYIGQPSYKKHGTAPIKLQAHGDKSEPISYRNIWVRELAN